MSDLYERGNGIYTGNGMEDERDAYYNPGAGFQDHKRGMERQYTDMAEGFSSPQQAQQMEYDVEQREEGMRLRSLNEQIQQSKNWGYKDYLAMAATVVPGLGLAVTAPHFASKARGQDQLRQQYEDELLSPTQKRDMLVGEHRNKSMTAQANYARSMRPDKESALSELVGLTSKYNPKLKPGSPEWMAKYEQLKGKSGTTVNVNTDPETGAPLSGLQKGVIAKAQDYLISGNENINKLNYIQDNYEESFSTLPGNLMDWYNGKKAYVFGKDALGDKETKTHEKFTAWRAGLKGMFNAYRKEITGAAAAEKELKQLEAAMVNAMDNPIEYRAKFELYKKGIQQNIRIRNKLLRTGGFKVGSKDYMEDFNAAFVMGADDKFEPRRDELKAAKNPDGTPRFTPQQIANRLKQEGYIGGGK